MSKDVMRPLMIVIGLAALLGGLNLLISQVVLP
jgi:hypothetical protein